MKKLIISLFLAFVSLTSVPVIAEARSHERTLYIIHGCSEDDFDFREWVIYNTDHETVIDYLFEIFLQVFILGGVVVFCLRLISGI